MTDKRGKVLVACPTYAGKEYALKDWVKAFKAYTYPKDMKFAYQVDNTSISDGYYQELKKTGIDVTHIDPWPDWDRTFLECWKLMLKRAKELDCYWVYSVEADNIPAPESLDIMVDVALLGGTHLVTHAYPMHKTAAEASGVPEGSWYYHELGCMLMTTQLLERAIEEFDEYGNIAHSIFSTNERYMGGWCKLTTRFEVKHLDGYEMSFQNLEGSQIPGLMTPTPKMPDHFGTELPPSLKKAGVKKR